MSGSVPAPERLASEGKLTAWTSMRLWAVSVLGEVPACAADDVVVEEFASFDRVLDGMAGVDDLVETSGHAVGADAAVAGGAGDEAWGGV